MKSFVILLLILFSGYNCVYAQERWISNIELDFVFPNKKDYFYNDGDNKINDVELSNQGFLLKSFGIHGDYNYLLLKKLSIGALGGFQTLSDPDYVMLKLGGILRYYFVDPDNVYIYLQDAHNFSLNKEKFKSGNNLRLGLGFPFLKRESFNLNANIFYEQNYFKLDGATPLLGLPVNDEIPRSLTVKSLGISLGVNF